MFTEWHRRGERFSAARGKNPKKTILQLELLEQRTVPSFLPPVNYPTGTQPVSVAVGDFNNDGTPDLAVTNLLNNNVAVLLGNGDGTFQPAVNYPVGMEPRFVAVADLNGDGIPDLVVVNHVGASSIGNVSVLLGNGDGTFQSAVNYDVGTAPSAVAMGDFGNGTTDLVVTNYNSNNVSILLGNGDGTFQPASNYDAGFNPESVAVGDFNGDGNSDLVVTNRFSNTVNVLVGNGDGTFQAPVPYAAGSGPFSVTVGDFNGGGVSDLAVANQNSNNVSILLGNGDGTFQAAQNYDAGPRPWSVVAADFNNDGALDLAVADNSSGVSVLLGNGDGTFQAPLAFMAGAAPFSVAAGDFNGDGFPDLAVANRFSNNVSVLINAGDWSGGRPSGRSVSLPKGSLASSLTPATLNLLPTRATASVMTLDPPLTKTAADQLVAATLGNDQFFADVVRTQRPPKEQGSWPIPIQTQTNNGMLECDWLWETEGFQAQ